MAIINNNTIMSQPYRFEIDGIKTQSCPLSDSKELVVYIDQTDNLCKGIIVTNNNGVWTKTEPTQLFNTEISVFELVDITNKEETNSDLNFVIFGSSGANTPLNYSAVNIDILSDSINLNGQQLIVDEVQNFCANSCRYGAATCLYQDRARLHIATYSATNSLNTAMIDFGENDIEDLYDSVFLKGNSVSSYQYIMVVWEGMNVDFEIGVHYSIIKFLSDLSEISVTSQSILGVPFESSQVRVKNISYLGKSNPNILLTYIESTLPNLKALLGRGDGTSTDDITMNFSGGGMSLDIDTGVLTYDVTKINDDKAFISYAKEAECFSVCVTADNTVGLSKGMTFGMGNLGASQFSISNIVPDNNTIVNYVANTSINAVMLSEQTVTPKIDFSIYNLTGDTQILLLSDIEVVTKIAMQSSSDYTTAYIDLTTAQGVTREEITLPVISGKEIVGLSTIPNSETAEILDNGTTYEVNYSENTTLYLAYKTLPPTPTYYDYDIKDNSGGTTLLTLKTTEVASTLRITKTNDIVTVQINNSVGGFTPPDVENMVFAGFSTQPNSISVEYEINHAYIVNFGDSGISLYSVYKVDETKNSIILYQNSAERNRVDKTNYLTQIGSIVGTIRESTSIIDIVLRIEYNKVPDFNYCYLTAFKRYYYVTDITTVNTNVWELSLSCDVLMSYKEAIKNCNGFIERNENTFNENIVDKQRVIEQGYDIEEITLENELFKYSDTGENRPFVISGYYIFPEGGAEWDVTYNGINCTVTGPNTITEATPITIKITPNAGYTLANVVPIVRFAVIDSFEASSGTLVISTKSQYHTNGRGVEVTVQAVQE